MSSSSLDSLPAQFDPVAIERPIYERWLAAGVFTAHAERSNRIGGESEPFTIVIPPPNVTAALHMGHGLGEVAQEDRKSTRLNSGHLVISCAVSCLKTKNEG